MATTYQEIAEQVQVVHNQAKAMMGVTTALLRTLGPLVEAEQNQKPERKMPRMLGQTPQE